MASREYRTSQPASGRSNPLARPPMTSHAESGLACAPQELHVGGPVGNDYSNVETEKTEHPLEFTAPSKSNVKVEESGEPGGPQHAGFAGTDEVHLASSGKWSAF